MKRNRLVFSPIGWVSDLGPVLRLPIGCANRPFATILLGMNQMG
jgi:hypothetical protein